MILGFPCNQFGSQDPGSDEEIQSFCQVNYGVSFPIVSLRSLMFEASMVEMWRGARITKEGWNTNEENRWPKQKSTAKPPILSSTG